MGQRVLEPDTKQRLDLPLQRAGFATEDAVDLAASLIDGIAVTGDPTPDGLLRRYALRVGPSVVQVQTTARGDDLRPDDRGTFDVEPEAEQLPIPGVPCSRRGRINSWSRKSRANMIRVMASIDWTPVVDTSGGTIPAMVTLTLPRDWLTVAPTAAEWKRLVAVFRRRWDRRWHEVAGVWKGEFQRRGAPHLHLYCAVPQNLEFRWWLSRTWTEIVFGIELPQVPGSERVDRPECNHQADGCSWPEGREVHDHYRAGTGIDVGEGIRASDPKRLAIYFAKMASQHNNGASKEYQHIVPREWMATGGAGRFWGYWRVEPATRTVPIHRGTYVGVRRLARRYLESQRNDQRKGALASTPRTSTSRRLRRDESGAPMVNENGEFRSRSVTRRWQAPRSMRGNLDAGGAFALISNAPGWIAQASGWLNELPNQPPYSDVSGRERYRHRHEHPPTRYVSASRVRPNLTMI